ncbi:Recombinase NinB [uncultured Caudovirales phage]|uniref:Recombinase NinB n=1 Tax=uncultured Caudovirales phage TaxID=2100421 RepID=A0A6J5KHV6_9CAUD|nr:Recombinase NinB [uncultured Caudovirales phage]
MTYEIRLTSPQQAKAAWSDIFPKMQDYLQNNGILTLTIKKKGRSNEQNRLMWVALGHISAQVVWHGQKLTKEEWKDVLTASLKNQRAVPGINGGFVVLGARTSKMTVEEMTEVLELAFAFGAEHGVKFDATET